MQQALFLQTGTKVGRALYDRGDVGTGKETRQGEEEGWEEIW